MNASNINNQPNAPGPIGRDRDVTPRLKGERAEQAAPVEETAAAPQETEVVEQTGRSTRDSFLSSRDRGFVREMTAEVENTEPPVREEAVARARQRVSEGYYNSRDFLGNLATRLINTDRVT